MPTGITAHSVFTTITSASSTETKPEEKTERRVSQEPPYKVILHNDDYTPMEHVIAVLRKVIPRMSMRRAVSIMLEARQMSTGLQSLGGVRRLISVERARGIRYYTASLSGCTVRVIGVFFDPMGETTELEPQQIIDMAVVPGERRKGVARAQMGA